MKRKTAKELLAESFRELAREREIDRITVQDIAKNCGYSIATFYRQFGDKYDLIAWDYARDVQKLLEQEDDTQKDWLQSLSDAAEYYDEQRQYLANLLTNTSGYDSFIRYMTGIHFNALMDRIRPAFDTSGPDRKTEMLVRLYGFGTVMLTCEWILGKYPVSRETLTEVYATSLPEPLRGYFQQEMIGYHCYKAKKVNARLIELGVTPKVELQEYPVFTDIREMLEYDCKDAAEALPMMSKALSLFEDDFVTRSMIQEFIVDEQDHFNWVRQHLSLMQEIGMENYLIEQLGE